MKKFAGVAAATLVLAAVVVPASDASAHARTYSNCTAMHRDYPHGVGKRHAHDKTSGTPVTNFKRSNSLYAANSGSDRDGDKIACEAH